MYTLFPPFMMAKQEAIISSDGGRIYFNLSTFNTIEQVKHIQVAINRQDNNQNALASNSLKYETGQYYVVDPSTGRPVKPAQTSNKVSSAPVYSSKYPTGYILIPVSLDNTVYYDESKKLYYFSIPQNILEPNLTYKVQIRFGKQVISSSDKINYTSSGKPVNSAWLTSIENVKNFSEWSTVGMFNTLSSYSIWIQDFTNAINSVKTSVYTFVGLNDMFQQNPDETITSYRFKLSDEYDRLIEDSGDIDNPASQKLIMSHTFRTVFDRNKRYMVSFSVLTKSNSRKEVSYSFISDFQTLGISYGVKLDKNTNGMTKGQLELGKTGSRLIIHDNGYKDLSIDDMMNKPNTYVLRKTSSRSNFKDWEEIAEIRCTPDNTPLEQKFFDPYVESGITYRYTVQPKLLNTARGLVSPHIETTANFDYSWLISKPNLFLKIAYNLNISGYKTVIKETMVETLGSKFPFFVRGGNAKYKQFTMNATITKHMDVENKMTKDLERDYMVEREFRNDLETLLLDGSPKVIKTDTEGLMLVHFSNISLTPETSLGRTIYSFSCTVTEVADFTTENLIKYGLVDLTPIGPGSDIRTQAILGIAVVGKTTVGTY